MNDLVIKKEEEEKKKTRPKKEPQLRVKLDR
jgi:hypothetical protein